MKRILSIILITASFSPLFAQSVRQLTTDEFLTNIFNYRTDSVWSYKGNKPCVIDFYASWCGPCKRLAPIMEELAEQYQGKVVFYKVDTEEQRELAQVFNISSIPQVLYIPKKGNPTLLKGLYPKENMIQIIDEVLLNKKSKQQAHASCNHNCNHPCK